MATMMFPPLDLADLNLLLIISGILLVITAELPPLYGGSTVSPTNKKRLMNAATITGILFLVTVALRIIDIISKT
jgi:hypothetical protein